ncbi:MAG: DUF2892 domain-containing protein [Verrucomicrobia bacterium]|nr:DUF2892 domain-containing protein [Verrucomicrobiota bacterium]
MALSCNIDRRGRVARGISGMVCVAAGAGCGWQGWWVAAVALAAAGAFQFFEARKGWCAVRALGIRTPM